MKKVINAIKLLACFFLSLLVIVSFYTLMCVKVFHKDYANFFGYTYFVIASGSMSPTIEVNDIIVVKINGEYKTGDIITYKQKDDYITHRVVNVFEDTIATKGDYNNTEDSIVKKQNVLGRVKLIISFKMILRLFGLLLIFIVIVVMINFEDVFKKVIPKNKNNEKYEDSPLDYTCIINLPKEEEFLRAEILEKTKDFNSIRAGKNKNLEIKLNKKVVEEKEMKATEKKKVLKEILEYISKNTKKPKITKKGAVKLKYLYKLTNTIILNPAYTEEVIDNVTFEELYNYSFDEIGFNKKIRDKLYELPVYNYILILTYAVIYDNIYYFDAVYKMLKYRIKLDVKGDFIKDKHKCDKCLKLIEQIIDASGKKDTFELEKIVDIIKLQKL